LTSCKEERVKPVVSKIEFESRLLNINKYGMSYFGMSLLKPVFLNKDSINMTIGLGNNLEKKVYIFNIGDSLLLRKVIDLREVYEKDSSVLQTIKPIGKDSLLIFKESSISIYNTDAEELVYFHKFTYENKSLLSQFSLPVIRNGFFYSELIEWDAQPLGNGVLNTRVIYKFDLQNNSGNCLPIRMFYENLYVNPMFKHYFNIYNGKLILSNSMNKDVRIYDLNGNKISFKTLKGLSDDEFRHSDISSTIDKAKEELLMNKIYSNVIINARTGNFYRFVSGNINLKNKSGMISKINGKPTYILEYNSEYRLVRIINTNLKGFLPEYFYIVNDELFCIRFDGGNLRLFYSKLW
jgi:hypothetical protein